MSRSGLGLDIVDIARFKRLTTEKPSLTNRILTTREIECANKFSDSIPHLAACFAAKEAYFKALGSGVSGHTFHEVELLHDEAGRPFLSLLGERLPALISISHTDTIVGAVVIL